MVPEEDNSLIVPTDDNTELNANAEFRGNKEDEEDILLTAQRYLNIFHQIHIFKEFRQKQFRQQLLEIPQEVRKVIALLPGGRVLLEHIAEIMEEDGQKDPTLDSLLLSLAQNDHFSDNKLSVADSNTPALSAPAGVPAVAPQVVAAPLELSSDFTNALTESFQAYSQNLKDLSTNIQKMALNIPHDSNATKEQIALNNDYAKALTASFQAYSQDLKDLTSSIQQMAQNQQHVQTVAPSSVEFGTEATKTLTSSFDAYARNLEDLTESIKKIASNQQVAASVAPTSIEIGGDFTKALTASFEAYSHNLEDLTESIKKIAVQNAPQVTAAQPAAALPNFTDSISTVLRENAQQQMDVLKSFGEMLSKTIADSQKELVSSIKNSNQSSVILGKFMQVPIDEAIDNRLNQTKQPQTVEQEPEVVVKEPPQVNFLGAADSESVRNVMADFADSTKTVLKEPIIKTPKSAKKETVEGPKTNKTELPKNESKSKSKKAEQTENSAPQNTEIDINDVFAQLETSLRSDTKADQNSNNDDDLVNIFSDNTDTSASSNEQNDILEQTFSDNLPDSQQPDARTAEDSSPAEKKRTKSRTTPDPMAQIRDALGSNEQLLLNNLDDVSPISLSPTDDLRDAFTEISAPSVSEENKETENNVAENIDVAESDENSWEYVDENGDPVNPSEDQEWEYEYVDEDGNPITTSDEEVEYEYVDEDGNPVEPTDDDTEYEYVDEDGNPIEPSDDDEWEYEYVDEDGNPING